MEEHDHAPLREAITAVVRETALKVLLCPEDMSQMEVGKEMVLDKLPADVRRARGVAREVLADRRGAQHLRRARPGSSAWRCTRRSCASATAFPAIVCRFAEQTSKGFMWRDIGLGDWLFDFDQEADIRRLVPAVLAMAKDPAAARAKVAQAQAFVQQRQRATMAVLRKSLPA